MTRILLQSDLHQEFTRDQRYGRDRRTQFDPAEHPVDFDVAVFAGDIDVPLTRSIEWIAERFPGVPVICVAGNHDFFNHSTDPEHMYTMDEMIERGRDLAAKHGIHLLQDSAVEVDGVRFLGGTLWTDFMTVGSGSAVRRSALAAGRHGMNDYKRIKRWSTKSPGKRKRLRPLDTIKAHRATRSFIESELQRSFDGPTIVVTHHAPHPGSLGSRKGDDLAFCYASNLSTILESENAPDCWMHGHLHGHIDYTAGNTRIVANARGYVFANDVPGFAPGFVVDTKDFRPSGPGMKT